MSQFLGIFSGLGAMFGWGTADFFAAKASKKSGFLQTVFVSQLLGLVIAGAIFFGVGADFNMSLGGVALMVFISMSFALGLSSFYYSLEVGPVSITSPIGSAYGLVTVLIAVLFLGERLTGRQWEAVFFIMLGIVLASLQFEKLSVRVSNKRGIIAALVAMFCWGLNFALWPRAVGLLGWFRAGVLQYIFLVMWLTLAFGMRKGGIKKLWGSGVGVNNALVALFQFFGTFLYSFGSERELTSILTPISSAYPALTVVFALWVFKERIQQSQLFGVGLIVVGLVLLAIR